MTIILDRDRNEYVDKSEIKKLKSYGNALWLPKYTGDAFYLPQDVDDGEGISDVFGNVVKFISDNKDTIKNVADTASSVVSAASSVAGNVIDNIKKVKELQAMKKQLGNGEEAIPEEGAEKIAKKVSKTGGAFHIIK
jgi:hypothetical protein